MYSKSMLHQVPTTSELSGMTSNGTSSAEHKERSVWTTKSTSDSTSGMTPPKCPPMAECPGCIAKHGTPHLCGIADEAPTTPSPVDQQPNVSYPTTAGWHQTPNIIPHQAAGGATYAGPPTGHVFVYSDSSSAYLHDPYRVTNHVTNVMQSGYARPVYTGMTNQGPVEMTRCTCGDPTCNQFVTLDVVGSTRVHQAMMQSNVFNGRNMYGLGHPQAQQQGYASPYQPHFQHQVIQPQQQQPQHHQPSIGPSGYTNVHRGVGPHQHLPVVWPPIGNSYVPVASHLSQAAPIEHSQRGGQHGAAHTVGPEVVHRLSTESNVATGGDGRIQTEVVLRGSDSTTTMIELVSEQIKRPDRGHSRSSSGQAQWRPETTLADGDENISYSERLTNNVDKVGRDVITTTSTSTVSHSHDAARVVADSYSVTSMTATCSMSSSATSMSSPNASLATTLHASNTGNDATPHSSKDANFINVAEKDLATTSSNSTDDVVTTTAGSGNGDTYQRPSAMTFVVDLGNKSVDEKAAAKLEWLQRRSSQRSRSIERAGDRNGSFDDVTQETQSSSSRRPKASLSMQRRRTVELFMGATSGAAPPTLGRQAPFTSPQLTVRSTKTKIVTSMKGYSSDDDDENNNKFAIFDKKRQNRSLIDKPPSGNSSVTGSRNQPMVVIRNDRMSSSLADGESTVVGLPLRGATAGHMSRDNQLSSKSYTSLTHRGENSDDEKQQGDPSETENTSMSRHRRRRQTSATRSNTDLVQQMLFSNQPGKANVSGEEYQSTAVENRGDRKKQTAAAPVAVDLKTGVPSDDEGAASDASGGTFVIGESDDEERAAHVDACHEDERLPESFTSSSDRKHENSRHRKTWEEGDGDRTTTVVHGIVENVVSRENGSKRLGLVDDRLSGASTKDNELIVGKTTARSDTIGDKISKLLFDTPTGTTPGGESANNRLIESRLSERISPAECTPDVDRPRKAGVASDSGVVAIKSVTSGSDGSETIKQAQQPLPIKRKQGMVDKLDKMDKVDKDKVDTEDVILMIYESSDDERGSTTSVTRAGTKRTSPVTAGSSKRHLPVVPPNNDVRPTSTRLSVDEAADNGRVIDVDFVAPAARRTAKDTSSSSLTSSSSSSSTSSLKFKMQQLINTKLTQDAPNVGSQRLRLGESFDDVTLTKNSTSKWEARRLESDASPLFDLSGGAKVCRTVIVQNSTQLSPSTVERFVPISPSTHDIPQRQPRSSSTSSSGTSYTDRHRKTNGDASTVSGTGSRTTPGRSMPRTQPALVSPSKDQRFFGGGSRTSATKTPSSGVNEVERPSRGGSVSPIKAVQPTTSERTRGGTVKRPTTVNEVGPARRETKTSTSTSGTQRMNSKNENYSASIAEPKSTGNRNRSSSRPRTEETPPMRLSRRVNSTAGNVVGYTQKTNSATPGSRSHRTPSVGVQPSTDRGRTSARPKADSNWTVPDNNGVGSGFRRSTSVGVLSGSRRSSSQSPVRTSDDQEKLQKARDQFKKRMNYDPSRSAAIARAQTIRRRVEAGSNGSFTGGGGFGSSEDDLGIADGSEGSIDRLSRHGSTSGSNRNSVGSVTTSDEELRTSVSHRLSARDRSSDGRLFRNSGGCFNEAVAKLSASVAGEIGALSQADLPGHQKTSEDDLVTTPFDRIQLRLILQLAQKVNQSAALIQQHFSADSSTDDSLQTSRDFPSISRQSSKTTVKLEEILHNLSAADRRLESCLESRNTTTRRSNNRNHKDA